MKVDVASKQLPVVDYGCVDGPQREKAVRRLTQEVLDAGDTLILGSMQTKRNRFRGQWRPGWIATCRAVKEGQAHGLGTTYEALTRTEQMRRFYQPSLDLSS